MQWKLILDFGLVVLIWMTQLVVYPSFTYFSENDLLNWHGKYTTAVSIVVMPLMLGQLAIHGFFIYEQFTWTRVIALILIGLVWINTFLFAVPLHNQIASGTLAMESASGLVRVNWYRTILWSAVFLLGLWEYLRK